MELKDILKDSKQYGDNLAISLNGQTFTLGALRQLSTSDQKALSDREKAISDRQAALDKATEELKAAQATTAKLFADTTALKEQLDQQAGNANKNKGGDNTLDDHLARLEQDNIFGPVVKYMKSQNSALKFELEESNKKLVNFAEASKRMAESYVTDRIYDAYESTVPVDKRQQFPIEQLIKTALDNKLVTRSGYADVKAAYSQLTAADRAAASEKELRDKLTKEITDDLLSKGIVVRPPTGMGGGGANIAPGILPGADRQPSQFKGLDDAFAAAAKDAELWKDFNSMPIA